MSWQIVEMPLDGPLFEGAIAVYGDAFLPPPYSDPDRGREIRHRLRTTHRYRPGYRGLVATEDGRTIGMAYGYRSEPGQWWHEVVAEGIGPEAARRWLKDAYELVEIAVTPSRQSRGVGSALIEDLLRDRTEATCVLSTRTDSNAHRLYARLGFQVIRAIRFTPGGAPFYVMGRDLR